MNDLLHVDISNCVLALADDILTDIVLFFEGDRWTQVEIKANWGLSVVSFTFSRIKFEYAR